MLITNFRYLKEYSRKHKFLNLF